MVIEYHPLYMRRLAGVYLDKYCMHGYESARKWFDEFLNDGMKARMKTYISALAEERDLEVD